VCGLRSEAAALGRAAAVSGARPECAESHARRLAGQGATALVSFGIAGALAPDLRAGDLLVPSVILDADGRRHAASAELAARLGLALGGGVLLGSDRLVATVADKARLAAMTGAIAVDMESHRVARAAHAAGLPVLAIRAIADPAASAIPASARDSVTADGRVRVAATLLRLLIRPRELPALLGLGRHSARAHATLRRAAARIRAAGA
jgi:adenosylhomocysteine nucleosidase